MDSQEVHHQEVRREANRPRRYSEFVGSTGCTDQFHLNRRVQSKVRAITAFVRLDRRTYEKQIAEALVVLRKAKSEFEAAGYQVETLRVTTQPLAELVAGATEDQALAFLARLDQLSSKEDFLPNVGPAMMHDNDDPATMYLLERALSTLPNIEANTIIADEEGMRPTHTGSRISRNRMEHYCLTCYREDCLVKKAGAGCGSVFSLSVILA